MLEFNSDQFPGLSESEAADRLKKYGLNELPGSKKRNIFKIILSVM
ncbi:MAG: cation-transporting P-type ATPase, partial [Spirochaetia bacterium]|nr:cation-transporting P-type ATPase [Spirochaetia bacterium]